MGLTRVYLWYSEVGGFDSHIGIRAWVVVFLPRYGYSFSAGKLRTLTWWCYRVWPTWNRRSGELDLGALAPEGGQEGTFAYRKRAEGSQNEKLHIEPTEGQHFTFSTIIKTRKRAEGTFLETRN